MKPLWSRSGTELFYLDAANALIVVPVQTSPSFRPGIPAKLFDGRYFAPETGALMMCRRTEGDF
jgi:hypothetical protein